MISLRFLFCFLFFELVFSAEQLVFVPIYVPTNELIATLNIDECSILKITNDLGETTEYALGIASDLSNPYMSIFGDYLRVTKKSLSYGYRCTKKNGEDRVYRLLHMSFIQSTGLKFLNSRGFYANGIECDFSVNTQCPFGQLVANSVLIDSKSLKDNWFVEIIKSTTEITYKMYGLLDASFDDVTNIDLNKCVGSTLVQKRSHDCDPDLDQTCSRITNPSDIEAVSFYRYSCQSNKIVYVHDFINVCRSFQKSLPICNNKKLLNYTMTLYENNVLTLKKNQCTKILLNDQEYSMSSTLSNPRLAHFLSVQSRIHVVPTQTYNKLLCFNGDTKVWSAFILKLSKMQTTNKQYYQKRGDVSSEYFKIFYDDNDQYVDSSYFMPSN